LAGACLFVDGLAGLAGWLAGWLAVTAHRTGEVARDGSAVVVDARSLASNDWVAAMILGVQLAAQTQRAEAVAARKREEHRTQLGLYAEGEAVVDDVEDLSDW
jgi:hypothetical protein